VNPFHCDWLALESGGDLIGPVGRDALLLKYLQSQVSSIFCPSTVQNGSHFQAPPQLASQLLDVLHRHERTVVAAGGLDGPRYHSGKSFAKFGKLRHQCLDHGRIFLK